MRPKNVLTLLPVVVVYLLAVSVASSSMRLVAEEPSPTSAERPAAASASEPIPYTQRPVSEFSVGVAASMLGLDFMVGTNLNQYMSLRFTGNLARMDAPSQTSHGIHVTGTAGLASAGVSLDAYPLPSRNWRVSPGILFYNANHINGKIFVPGGSQFTLHGTVYTSSPTDPVSGSAKVNLHALEPEFMITTGWDNIIPHKNHNWTFPFEIGILLDGTPNLNLVMNGGHACNAQGANCLPVLLYPSLQQDLAQQSVKYASDISWIQTYPLCSFGVVYTFRSRR